MAEKRVSDLKRQLAQAKAQEERAARLYTLGANPALAEQQIKEAVARRKAIEEEYKKAESAISAKKVNKDLQEQVYSALLSLRDRIGTLSLDEKRQILRLLVPGGLTHRIEVQKVGTVDLKGIINFDPFTHTSPFPYSVNFFDNGCFKQPI